MKKYIHTILISIIMVLMIVVGLYIRAIVKVLNMHSQAMYEYKEFMIETFPEEVEKYITNNKEVK